MESKELALALDLFGQAVRDMTKLEIEGAGSEPSIEYIRSGLHAELCRSDVVKVVTAEVERAISMTLDVVAEHDPDYGFPDTGDCLKIKLPADTYWNLIPEEVRRRLHPQKDQI